MAKIVVLATGGTIAGVAETAADGVGYRAGALDIGHILLQVDGLPELLAPDVLEAVQVASVDSKDMHYGLWQRLMQLCAQALARPDVRAVVITHGSDTLEETAFFLSQWLDALVIARGEQLYKPVVLTCAMRPATARMADGPQNLADAMAVARDADAAGVLVVCAGRVHGAHAVRKIHPYRLDPFDSGDAGVLGYVEEGRMRWTGQRPAVPAGMDVASAATLITALGQQAADAWPWVEVLASHAGSHGRAILSLVAAGVKGIVLAGTGNATVHEALQQAALEAVRQGVVVWRSSRCEAGQVVEGDSPATSGLPLASCGNTVLAPFKARVALMLALMHGAP